MLMLRIPFTDKEASNFFSEVIRKTIKHRETTEEKREDFLQLLMEARNDSEDTAVTSVPESFLGLDELSKFEQEAQLQTATNKVSLTEDVILSQSLLFFIGGFDTMETMLLMVAYELAINSNVQERLYRELQEASELNNGQLDYDLIMKLEYLDMVVSETLRKWPPGVRLERKSTKPYNVPNSDVVLDKDTLVVVPVYGMHHDEQYYPDPETFDPERFTPENKIKRHPYCYLPFGAGPRNCIAIRFALAEGKAAIAHLILNFRLQPSVKTDIPLKFKTTSAFKPANGLWLSVESRK